MKDLRGAIRTFIEERDWEQFHSPKNLAMAFETVENACQPIGVSTPVEPFISIRSVLIVPTTKTTASCKATHP